MKITVWLATRDRTTWVAVVEVLGLALLLLVAPGPLIRLFLGLPLLAHLGYTAMTGLPVGSIPGRPLGTPKRRNQDLRTHVVGFLNEVRRVEEYAQHARTGGVLSAEIDENLRAARSRMMSAAAEIAKATGRVTLPEDEELPGRGTEKLLVHQKPMGPATS